MGAWEFLVYVSLQLKKKGGGGFCRRAWLSLLHPQLRKSSEAFHLPIPLCLSQSNLKQKILENSHTGEQSSF